MAPVSFDGVTTTQGQCYRVPIALLATCSRCCSGTCAAARDGFASVTSNERDGSATVTLTAEDSRVVTGAGRAGGGGGPAECQRDDGQRVPCSSDLGWWSATYDCYLKLVAAAEPDDLDHAGEGRYRCDPGPLGWGAGPAAIFLWLPLGADAPDPAVLADQAVEAMGLRGITVGMAPPPGTQALVNAPVWLWAADPGENSWGPISATAAAGGVSVTATARATSVTWSMGDGSVVTCGRGEPYPAPSGTGCTHTYRSPGTYQVTAATGWQVAWTASTGAAGSDALQTTSSVVIDVREARARITARD